jgi:peptidoglycan/xylan/chitin deacetylase (PgdA/CDA1 family)
MGYAAMLVVGGVVAVSAQRVLARLDSHPKKTYALRDDILIHGNEDLKEVALTFDDGPRPEIAREMLNVLGRYRARSTFFVVGSMVEQHPKLVRRMMNEGHEVANHSYSHPRLHGMDEDAIRAELARCDRAVFDATGARTNLFRPPGMRYDDTVLRAAQSLGYVTVHWNVAAQDFKPQPSDQIARKVLEAVKPGSVVLLHGHPDTLAALPMILDKLREKGYRFVTVSQMLGRLERPVYVKTNAYGAIPEAKPVAKPATRIARKVGKPALRTEETTVPAIAAPPAAVDVPSWN